MRKKLLALFVLAAMAIPLLSGCSGNKTDSKAKEVLDGKKVLFLGSSATYYGGCVTPADDYNMDRELEPRMHDNGFFYQLCRAAGAEVNVVDWTFGGHGIMELLGDTPCTTRPQCEGKTPNGHLAFLTDRVYDYVIIEASHLGKDNDEAVENMRKYIDFFKAENPNVKVFYAVPHIVYARNWSRRTIQLISRLQAETDVTILDWGTLVEDVITGKVQVPGATLSYNKCSFVVSADPTDGYHQNILSGYLNALMAFCAITGTDAVGQPYDFCYTKENENYPISIRFLTDYYTETYYRYDNKETPDVNERKTNFVEIFRSEADMKGLQSLVNTYLDPENRAWEKYITE